MCPWTYSFSRPSGEMHVGLQVGRTGSAVGIDITGAAVQLGRASVQGLVRADPEFARQAAPLRFYTHNVFMPSLRHKVACSLAPCSSEAHV